jgi:uncharacterized Tic20 family protein
MDSPQPDPSQQPPPGSPQVPPPQYEQPVPPPQYQQPVPPSPDSVRTFQMLAHLSAFAGLFIPFGNILGPFVVWMIKKDEMPSLDAHGKESMNFQISLTIYLIVSFILWFVLIGIPITIALSIFWLVMVIMASVKANEGVLYKYPLTIRFIN